MGWSKSIVPFSNTVKKSGRKTSDKVSEGSLKQTRTEINRNQSVQTAQTEFDNKANDLHN